MDGYLPRLLDPVIRDLLAELPALLIVGPRATGKTTTAAGHANTVVRLDRTAEAAAFEADPDAALAGLPTPVLLDEWQSVPAVLGAVKRAVDQDPKPGRFLLTGSVRADLDHETWPGTGRLVRLRMLGMTQAERLGLAAEHRPFLDRLATGEAFEQPADPPDLRGYLEMALRGGFPTSALRESPNARQRWLESYVEQLITSDAAHLESGRDPERIRRYFEAYALNSAGVVNDKTLFEAADINRKTANAYEQLLKNLLVIESIPAWSTNRIKRLVKSPKRYLTDAALAGALLRVDVAAAMRDGDLLGRLLDTFVASHLRAELEICTTRPRLFHLRAEDGRHEIDLLAELGGHRVLGVEIKASAAPRADDAKHLAWLRDQLDDRFVAGVILHTGPKVYRLGDRIQAVPICCLWAQS